MDIAAEPISTIRRPAKPHQADPPDGAYQATIDYTPLRSPKSAAHRD
ncbi:Uncharacterised protein [Vibrio cholerae]|nr:Uncharacterised protein [Vibrio cholerae]